MMHVYEYSRSIHPLDSDHQHLGFDRRFLCPLANSVMTDPVMLPCGHSFERYEIQKWVDDHGHCCPLDHEQFESSSCIKPNYQLQWEILYHTRRQQAQQKTWQHKKTQKAIELMNDFDIDFHPSLKRGTLVASKASRIVETTSPLSPVRPAFLSDEASSGSMSKSRTDNSLTNCLIPQRRESIPKTRSDSSLTNCRMPQRMKSVRSAFLSDEGSPTGKTGMSKSRSDNSLMNCRLPKRVPSFIHRKEEPKKGEGDSESQGMKNATFEAPNKSSAYHREYLPTKISNKNKLCLRNEALTIF